mgnify:FL=1
MNRRSNRSTAFATVVDLLEIQQSQIERHERKDDLWRRQPLRFLTRGLLQQVSEISETLGLVKQGPLDPKTLEQFERTCANGANYFAFLAARVRALTYIESAHEAAKDSEASPEEMPATTETAA